MGHWIAFRNNRDSSYTSLFSSVFRLYFHFQLHATCGPENSLLDQKWMTRAGRAQVKPVKLLNSADWIKWLSDGCTRQILFQGRGRGSTRLLLYFNTNKPHSSFFFLQNTSCIRKPQVISGRGAHPLHPPPRSAPVFTIGFNCIVLFQFYVWFLATTSMVRIL